LTLVWIVDNFDHYPDFALERQGLAGSPCMRRHRMRSMTVVKRMALVATVGDPGVFGNGREMAA